MSLKVVSCVWVHKNNGGFCSFFLQWYDLRIFHYICNESGDVTGNFLGGGDYFCSRKMRGMNKKNVVDRRMFAELEYV
ncbi:hypothetical protein QFZ80_004609 [Paenibacillus sp. V4I7]|nr:hypothetical protein [Paenibacillus sp. V4I7]